MRTAFNPQFNTKYSVDSSSSPIRSHTMGLRSQPDRVSFSGGLEDITVTHLAVSGLVIGVIVAATNFFGAVNNLGSKQTPYEAPPVELKD